MERFMTPLFLTTIAGLSTGAGSLVSLSFKKINRKILSLMMGFSAGVMVYISFTELLTKSIAWIGFLNANLAFFGGMFAIALIDFLIPHDYIEEMSHRGKVRDDRVLLAGIFTALGLAIHNFPEGMAVFAASLKDPHIGISLTVAIALHNIPEGVAVAMPIYYATGSRKKGFIYSFLSGVAEPVGAIIAMLILMPYLNDTVLNAVLAAVGGLMVFISFDEILPVTFRDEGSHLAIVGIIGGMIVMALSLALF
ncbi:MAG: zinc transporter ZupT [Acidobacteriota bacterium]